MQVKYVEIESEHIHVKIVMDISERQVIVERKHKICDGFRCISNCIIIYLLLAYEEL